MAIKWDTEDRIQVGIDVSVSGTKITVKYYGGTTYSAGIDDTQTLKASGAISFTDEFRNNSSDGNPVLVATKTMTGTRGKTYSFSATLSGVYNGATPSVSDSIKVPATVPSKPSTPKLDSVGQTSATISWTKPSGNGDAVDYMNIQVDNSSGFGSPAHNYTDSASPSYPGDLTPNTTYYCRVRAHNSEGYGSWSNTLTFKTEVAKPSAPSIGTPTRNSDTSITVRWSNNSSGSAPYASLKVYVKEYGGEGVGWPGSWTSIGSAGSSATTFTWTGAKANRIYMFLVQAVNASGTSNSASSVWVFTTPATPATMTATKNAAGNIVLKWTRPDTKAGVSGSSVRFDVWESAGGAAYTQLANDVTAETWTHTSPNPSVTHQYRVLAQIVSSGMVGNGLQSGWRYSNVVQLLAPPNAPTNLKSTPAGVVDRTLPVTLLWAHNPVDSSDQTKFQVRHREAGTSTWATVAAVTSGDSTWTLPGGTYLDATQVEWQVMTWGLHATGSPWSASAVVSLSSKPTVELLAPAPDEVLTTGTLTAEWEFTDPEGELQTGWELTLLDQVTSEVVESRVAASDATTGTLASRLKDGGAYTVQLHVQDESGLWSSPVTADVTVAYASPPVPEVTGTVWDEMTASVDVQFAAPAPGPGEAEIDHFEVWRRIDLNPWELLTDQLPSDAGDYVDPTPSLAGVNTYLVVAVSAIPSESQSVLTEVTRTNYVANPRAVSTGKPMWSSANATESYVTGVWQDLVPEVSTAHRYTRDVASGSITGAFDAPVTPPVASVAPGQWWAGGVVVIPSATGKTVRAILRWGDATGTFVAYTNGPDTATTAGEPIWLSVAGQAPASAATLHVGFVNLATGAVIGDYYDLTAGLLLPGEVAPAPGDYFDGDTITSTLLTTTEWTGAEDASASQEVSLLSAVYVDGPNAPGTPAMFLNASSRPELAARMFHDVAVTKTTGREKVLNQFAGRTLPVESTGTAEDTSWQVTGTLRPWWARELDPEGMENVWEEVGLAAGPHFLRCPYPGIHELVSISGLSVAREPGGAVYTVSFTATKVSAS